MHSQVSQPVLNKVPLREGVKAVLQNSQFSVTPVSEEQNHGLAIPVDFVARSNGVRIVVKCLSNPEDFQPSAMQSLVDFSRGHGITEVMIIGDGQFSPELEEVATGLSVQLTNQEAYLLAFSRLPEEVIQRLAGDAIPAQSTQPLPAIPEKPFVAKWAFDNSVPPKPAGETTPPPLPTHTPPVGAAADAARMDSDLRDALPQKKKSAMGSVGRLIAIVLLIGIIWVGFSASRAGLKQYSKIVAAVNEAAQAPSAISVKKIVENTIVETRKSSGLVTAAFDRKLINFLEPQVEVMTIGGRMPTSKTLEDMLGEVEPGFRVGSSTLFIGEKPEELASQVKSWSPLIEMPDDEFGSISQLGRDGKVWAWVYHGNRISRKQQLDDALNQGGRFVLKCAHCGEDTGFRLSAHAKFFVKPECSHCRLTAHAFGPNTEGDYLRVCDFLTGFKVPDENVTQFLPANPEARTPKSKILAHWSAILDRCDYELDTKQKGDARRDVWKLPQQTWDERVGDCEDTTILLADALISAGYDARVVLGHWQGEGHAWCVVKSEGRQWILETTQPLTGAASLRSIIKVGGDYVAMCTFNRDSIFLRRHAANLSTPDYFSDNYWMTLNLNEVEGERNSKAEIALKPAAE